MTRKLQLLLTTLLLTIVGATSAWAQDKNPVDYWDFSSWSSNRTNGSTSYSDGVLTANAGTDNAKRGDIKNTSNINLEGNKVIFYEIECTESGVSMSYNDEKLGYTATIPGFNSTKAVVNEQLNRANAQTLRVNSGHTLVYFDLSTTNASVAYYSGDASNTFNSDTKNNYRTALNADMNVVISNVIFTLIGSAATNFKIYKMGSAKNVNALMAAYGRLTSADTFFSKGNSSTNFGSNTTVELKTSGENTDNVAVLKFTLPSIASHKIKSATLKLVTERIKGTTNVSVYPFDDFAESDTYSAKTTNITTARGKSTIATFDVVGPVGSYALTAASDPLHADYTTATSLTNTIDVTNYVKGLSTDYVSFMLVGGSSDVRFFSKEAAEITKSLNGVDYTFKAEDLVPKLIIEWEEKYPVYNATTGIGYSTLNAAWSALDNNTTEETLKLNADVTIDATCSVNTADKTVNVVPKADVSISRGTLANTAVWFSNQSTGTLTLGSSEYALTFAGAGHNDNQRIFMNILGNESTGRMNIENVTFQNFKFDTYETNLGYIFLNKNYNGKLVLKNVTVSNCITTEDAFIKSVSTYSDCIYLQGAINFNSCKADNGAYMFIKGRIRLGEVENTSSTTITTSNPISIYWAGTTTSIGTNVIVKALRSMLSSFTLTNTDLGLFANNFDLKLTQAYNLAVSKYEAATLILPFQSTIPTETSCYTLHYKTGNDKVSATEVTTTTLEANTPVLVNADEGNHKFVSTATSGSLESGSSTHTTGALTGVYEETTVPSDSYILWANETNPIGFYKSDGSTNKVKANRAYLTADGAGARLSISFDDEEETTGVADVRERMSDVRSEYFDLSGRRVAQLTKGLYIVNGKKVVIK